MLRLAAGARLRLHRGALRLAWRGRRLRMGGVPERLSGVFRRLAGRGGTETELDGLARRVGGVAGVTRWRAVLARLEGACAVRYEARDRGRLLGCLVPMAGAYREAMRSVTRGRRVLSRFAVIRRGPGGLVVESPLAYARVEVAPGAVPTLAALARGVRPDGASRRAGAALTALLDAGGMVTAVGADGRTAEDADPVLRPWENADLLFHARSRLGRHDAPAGATFDHLGRIPPLPAIKPPMARRRIALPRPDLARLARTDPPLTRVLEQRRSVRDGRGRLTVAQVGEFLFRVARVRRLRRPAPDLPYETTSRPYPSGGACYPLELYLAVRSCDGLPPGLYHYDPRGHRLELLPGGEAQVEPLLRDTRFVFGPDAAPLLLVITARFGRVIWKYRSMAYSVLLKDVGVLMQTMYLVATAMGLAPCAVGCGDAERSARALGTRFEEESSVGEFLLGGSRAAR